MAKRKQLDLEALDQLIEKVDKVYGRLLDLEQKIGQINGLTIRPQIDVEFLHVLDSFASNSKGAIKAVDELGRILNSLVSHSKTLVSLKEPPANLPQIMLTFKAIVDFVGELNVKDQTENIRLFGKSLSALVQALSLAGLSAGSTGGFTVLAGELSRFLKLFAMLPALFTWLTIIFKSVSLMSKVIPSTDEFLRLTEGIGNLGIAFKGIGDAFGTDFMGTFAAAIKLGALFPALVTGLVVVFKGLSLILKIIPGGDAFDSFTMSIRRLSQSFVKISESLGEGRGGWRGVAATAAALVRIGVIFPMMTTALTVVFKGLSVIMALIPGQSAFERFARALSDLGNAFANINESLGAGKGIYATIGSIIRIGVVFPVLFTQLAVVFRAISMILAILPGGDAFSRLAAAFHNIGSSLSNISRFTGKFNVGSLLKFWVVIKLITQIFKSMTHSFVKADALEPFAKLAEGMANVGKALVDVEKSTRNLGVGGLIRLVVSLKLFSGAVRGIGKGVSLQEANTIAVIASAMEAVGKSIRKISISLVDVKKLDYDAFGQFKKLLNALKSVVKDFGKVAGNSDPKGIEAIGALVNAIGIVIRSLTKLHETNTKLGNKDEKSFDVIRVQFRALRDLLKDMKRMGSAKLTDISTTVTGLATLLSTMAKVSFDPGKVEQLKTFVRGVGEAIKELNFGFRSGGKIKGLESVAKSFEILNKIKSGGSVVASLSKLLAVLKDFDSDKINLKGVGAALREMSRHLVQLGKTKMDAQQLERAEAYIDLLTKQAKAVKILADAQGELASANNKDFGLAAAGQSAQDATVDYEKFSEAVYKGTERSEQRTRQFTVAWKVAMFALREFNPIAVFDKVHRVVSGVGDAVQRVIGFFNRINQAIKSTIDSLSQMGQNLSQFGQDLVSKIGVGVLVGSVAFSSAVDFDSLSTQLQVFGRLTDEQLVKAQDFANEIGIQYPLSANEAMQAILDLTKAGQELPDIEQILPSAADLASLSDSKDIQAATQLLISAQASFKDFADGVPASFGTISSAADIVSNTADATTASIEDIQASLENIGPIASQYGLSFADVNAILGTFADSSLKGSDAGTALKSALTNLTSDTARAELAKLGVSLTDSEGNFRDFNDVIVDINTALNSSKTIQFSAIPGVSRQNAEQVREATQVLENAQRQLFLWQNQLASGSGDPEKQADKVAEYNRQIAAAQALLTNLTGSQAAADLITAEVSRSQLQNAESIKALFGSYGQVAGSILLTAGGFGDLRDKILNSGTAAERAQRLMDNFKGDIEQLRGSVETLNTKAFLPLIEKVFRPFVKLGRFVVDSLLQMDTRVLEFISTAVAFGSILATVIGTASMVVGTLISVGSGFALLALNLTNIFVVIGGIIGGLGALAVGLVVIAGAAAALAGIVAAVTAVFEALRKIFTEDLGGARTAFEGFVKTIGEGAQALIGFFQSLGSLLGAVLGQAGQGGLTAVGENIAEFFNGLAGSSKIKAATDTLNGFKEVFDVFTGALTLDARAKAAYDQTMDDMDNIPIDIRSRGIDIRDQADASAEEVRKSFDKMTESLAQNQIFTRIFGDDELSQADVKRTITDFLYNVSLLRGAIRDFLGFFGKFFDNVKTMGIGRAFAQLGTDLKAGLENVVIVLLEGLQDVFKFNTSDIVSAIKLGGLTNGFVLVFRRALDAAKNKLIQNRQGITGLLKSIFQAFFMPLKSIGFVAKLFGIGPLESIVNEMQRIVGGVFEGIVNTLFNLLEGMSLGDALRDAFGPGIEPLLDFIDAIGNVAETIITILGNIFEAIFGPIPTGEDAPQFIDVLNNILGGLTSFINDFNTNILSKLAEGDVAGAFAGFANMLGSDFLGKIAEDIAAGDWGGVISDIATELWGIIESGVKKVPELIIGLGDTLNSPILTKIGESLRDGDFGSVVTTIASGIAGVFTSAIGSVPGLIINLGTTLNSPILTKIGESLRDGDFGAVIATIASGVAGVFTSAIGSVPGLIINLGTTLNSPILTKIGESLRDGEFGAVITTIASSIWGVLESAIKQVPSLIINLGSLLGSPFLTKMGESLDKGNWPIVVADIASKIKGVIEDALGQVPTLLTNLGGLLNLDWLEDFGMTLEKSNAFKQFVDALGSIFSYPMEVVGSILDGVKGLVENLSSADSATIGRTAAFLSLVGVAIGGLIIHFKGAEIASKISGMFTALKAGASGLLTAAAPILAVAAAVLLIKNALENLFDFLSGEANLGEFIGDTLSGIVSDVLSFAGIEVSPEEISQKVSSVFDAIVLSADQFIRRLVGGLGQGMENLLRGIQGQIDLLVASLQTVGGVVGSGELLAAADAINKNMDFGKAIDEMNLAISRGLTDTGAFERLFANNFDGLMWSMTKAIQSGDTKQLSAAFQALNVGDLFDEAFEKNPADLTKLFSAVSAIDPALVQKLDLDSFAQGLLDQALAGNTSSAALQRFVDTLPGISEDQRAQILAKVQEGLMFQEALKVTFPAHAVSIENSDAFQAELARTMKEGINPAAIIHDLITQTDFNITEIPNLIKITPELSAEEKQALQSAYLQKLSSLDFETLNTEFLDSVQNGGDADAAVLLMQHLINPNITPEQRQQIIDSIKAEAQNILNEAQAQAPTVDAAAPAATTEIPIQVTPTAEVPPDAAAQVQQDAAMLVNAQMAAAPAAEGAAVDVAVAPQFTMPTTVAEMATFGGDILVVIANLTELQNKLSEFVTNSQPTVDQLNLMSTGLTEIKNTSFSAFQSMSMDITLFATQLQTSANTVILPVLEQMGMKIFSISSQVSAWAITMPVILGLNANAWKAWGSRAQEEIQKVQDMIDALSAALNGVTDVIFAISGVASAPAASAAAASAPAAAPGRAEGGPVAARQIYEVIEQGIPELFHAGGKTYLIPASNGYVTPLESLGTGAMSRGLSQMPAAIDRPNSPLTSGISTVNINEGDIVIQINGADATNPAALAATVREQVRAELENRNTRVSSTLRSGHR